ncbi:hypothetical protein HZS_1373 [Henneguya salminicola]|nr:hypothetical protein HZS_1373 [Henneguya salminicola]
MYNCNPVWSRTLQLLLKCAGNSLVENPTNQKLVPQLIDRENIKNVIQADEEGFGDIFAMIIYNSLEHMNNSDITYFLNSFKIYYKYDWISLILINLCQRNLIEIVLYQLTPELQLTAITQLATIVERKIPESYSR